MLDVVYIVGPALSALIFAAFALLIPQDRPILRNLFFLVTFASLLLTVNMSVFAAKAGDWMLDSSTLNATSNVTAYTYVQKAPTFNPADLDNIYLVMSSVIWIVFAYTIVQLFSDIFKWIARAFGMKMDEVDG